MSLRDKLLELFDGEAGRVFSGEHLARDLGVSRTAVWKQVQALKAMGLPIESTGRQGYKLGVPFDRSLAAFRGPSWTVPHYSLHAASTQTMAKAGAAASLPEGHLWIAETQTQGRGRLDRRWESGYGGLWFSLLLRPKLPPARVAPLSLLAGLALREALSDVCRIDAKLKWPNDVLAASSHKKLAGILTEMSGQMERIDWVVVGTGLNVNNVISNELSDRAASLHGLTGKVWERASLLEGFLKKFQAAYARCLKEGFEPFRRAYWDHYYAPGKTVNLHTAGGKITGIVRGVDARGAIMIESRRKISAYSEGEIVL